MACVRFRRGSWGIDFRDARGRRRWHRAGSELEARRLLEALERERAPGPAAGDRQVELTVSEYAELFFGEVRARSKPTTLARYRTAYRRHLEPELGGRRLVDVSRFELKRLLVRKHEAGVGLAMPLKVASMLFAAAYDDGLLARNPAARLKRLFRLEERHGAEPKAFTAGELGRFLEAAGREPVTAPLFRTMALSGLRTGEARALQLRDVDLAGWKLDVRRTFAADTLSSSPKSGLARRVEIPAELVVELEELVRRGRLRPSEDWLFVARRRGSGRLSFLRETAVRDAFKRALGRARLPRHFTPHCLRHTYASLLIQQGARAEYVQRQLGHHSIALTVDVYGRWLELSSYPELERLVRSTRRSSRTPAPPAVTDDDEPATRRAHVLRFERSRARARTATPGTSCSQRDEGNTPEGPA